MTTYNTIKTPPPTVITSITRGVNTATIGGGAPPTVGQIWPRRGA